MERKGAKPWNKERTKKGGCRLHMAWAAKPARHGWEPGRGGSLWRPSGTLAFALTPCVTDRMALGCDWAKPTATTGNDSASGNWRRKSAPCVSSRENKRRLLIFKNPWASCRNHSRNISLRAGITPPWSRHACPWRSGSIAPSVSRNGGTRRSGGDWRNCAKNMLLWVRTASVTCSSRNSVAPASVSTGRCGLLVSQMPGLQSHHQLPA